MPSPPPRGRRTSCRRRCRRAPAATPTGRFAAPEDSRAPLRIWALRHGRLAIVTRAYPAAIRADAAAAWSEYRRRKASGEDVRGVLAARVADECLLGNAAAAVKLVRSLP